ncbi:hypothetical protein L7F22_026947 [Adiantum nelumboides]|nr:hypothetical protein [Adiantum nelumboides]
MHAAKQRRIKRQQIIDEALEEARIRVLKRKVIPMNNLMTGKQLKTPSTDAVATDEEWLDGMDLRIILKLNDHNIKALVNTRARINAVSYSTHKKATDQPLQPGVSAVKALQQRRKFDVLPSNEMLDNFDDDRLCAKLHLVDLAGSERVKRTGADGMRFKEGRSGYWAVTFFQQFASIGNNIAIQIAAGTSMKAIYNIFLQK